MIEYKLQYLKTSSLFLKKVNLITFHKKTKECHCSWARQYILYNICSIHIYMYQDIFYTKHHQSLYVGHPESTEVGPNLDSFVWSRSSKKHDLSLQKSKIHLIVQIILVLLIVLFWMEIIFTLINTFFTVVFGLNTLIQLTQIPCISCISFSYSNQNK